mgnify:CR=1 FL=1
MKNLYYTDMDNEQDFEFPQIDVSVNGKKIESDDIFSLIWGLERVLKDVGAMDSDYSLEMLSKEASAVVSKCGY